MISEPVAAGERLATRRAESASLYSQGLVGALAEIIAKGIIEKRVSLTG
jgi:hypothetical protein